MASLETVSATEEISPPFDKLLKDVSSELSPEELRQAVSSIKSNFKGKFEDQQEQDLYLCLRLFANQGLVSEDNLTLLERFVTPKTSKKETIQEKIQGFKKVRQRETKAREELTGRDNDLKQVMTKLTTGSSSVVNLYGSSGVGKTRLAIEAFSKWPGRNFKVDFRGINEMTSVHFHVLNALTVSRQTILVYEANPVIAQMEQLKRDSQSDILLLLDNVDQFSGGDGEASADLNVNFVTFLQRLLHSNTDAGKSKLKILLTSRTTLSHGDTLDVDNYEVKALDNAFSSSLLQTFGTRSLEGDQMEKLLEMCHGNPLILNGMAAILRQSIANDKKLLGTIEPHIVTEPSETGLLPAEKVTPITQEREIFDHKKEGIYKDQENCLRKMFFFLPSERLKESAVCVSLFCRSFSAEAAATILGVDPTEAVIQLEGLRNSEVVSVDPEAKVLSYDIHPLTRTFLRSIGGNSNVYIKVYQKARDQFCNLFMSNMKKISAILDENYVDAFNKFDLDKPNFELALNISLRSDHLLIPQEHHESIMICYLFEAMLDVKQRRSIFNSWAEKAKDDGKNGSLLRAELKCREALQVLKLEGWQKALEVVKMANESLKTVQKETKRSKFFKLTRSSYLYVQGEVFYSAGNMAKALRNLHRSLKIMEDMLQSHTSITRCLNAIGNCHNKLDKPDEAIEYYTKAYEMRTELSGSVNHFDMPFFKGQIGTVYELKGQIHREEKQEDEAGKQFRKAIECYQEALELAKELKIPGMLNTALFNRNIANTYAWLREFEEAYQPAKNAYEIRKDILGNHPHTARSAFQMAEICRLLEDYGKAKQYYEQAWEIEKSLGAGNHSAVMVRIVDSYEPMLEGVRKEEFQKEMFEFYQRYWTEEREFERFEFSLANKTVIDSINDRLNYLADRETQKKYEREALWFYQGAWNSPDTRKLPDKQRGEILQSLLRLCNIVHEKDLLKKYEVKAFRFYEKLWKKNKEKMKKQDREDILTKLKKYASSLKDERKAKMYGTLLKQNERSGTFWGSVKSFFSPGSAAETLSSDDDDDSDKEADDQDDDSDNDDDDDTNGSQDLTEKLSRLTAEQPELGELENPDDQEPDKMKIHEGKVTSEGDTWCLEEAAASVIFCPGAVTKSLLITCSLWSPSTLSPPLGSNEALVSNVIELSHDGPPDLEFSRDAQGSITVALMHSASDLKGYEVVIKQLVDPENNEWIDLVTKNIWHASAKSAVPPVKLIPSAEATCTLTRHSAFAAVWRLKSFTFSRHNSVAPEFTCIVPDYPDVSVQIPWNCVPTDDDFSLTLKVQEFPSSELKGESLVVSPILDILSSRNISRLEPVTIQIPLTLREGKKELAQLFPGHLRILHCNSGTDSHAWKDITEQLDEPASITDGIVTFKLKHFSRIWLWIQSFLSADKSTDEHHATKLSSRSMPQHVEFSACLWKTRKPEVFVLHMFCYPSTLQHEVDKKLSNDDVRYQGQGTSVEPVCIEDYISVSLQEPLIPQDMENVILRFLGNKVFNSSALAVSLGSEAVPQVEFFKSHPVECQNSERLCRVTMRENFVSPRAKVVPTCTSSEAATHSRRAEVMDFSNRELQVILLGTEWRSTKGGLSTINRELAKELSSNPEVKVTLFVPQSTCSEDDKEIARRHGITIIEAELPRGSDDQLSLPKELIIDVIIGHGVKLGRQAKVIRHLHRCKWVQMVHTAPEQLSMYKSYPWPISKGEEKNISEVALCEDADLVVTIGPKLRESVSVSLRSCGRDQTVFSMIPGIFSEFYCVKSPPVDAEKFYVLAFGRCDPEDFLLKGFDIAAEALAELNERSYHLTVVGATDGKQEQLMEKLLEHGISRCQLTVRTFCKDRENLGKVFSQNDLVIMPSKTEGFGLTALEALSAGLPILVSSNSGFADALKKVPFGEMYVVEEFENVKEWAKKIKAVRNKNRAQRLEEIKKLRTMYEEKYSWKKQCKELVAKMTSLVQAKPVHP